MKKIVRSFLLISIACNTAAAQNDRDFADFETDIILQKLFDATAVNTGIAEWKPNFAERLYLNTSANGYSYTTIDTIIRFKVKTELAVIVFHTYATKELATCDTCSKLISISIFEKKDDSKWTMRAFNKITTKYMQPGKVYNYRLVKINSLDIYALAFNIETGLNGGLLLYRDLYLYNIYNPDYYDINLALSAVLYYSNKENSNKKMHYSYSSDVKFIPRTSWYGIEITTKGMMPDFNGTGLSPYNAKTTYFFDQSFMAYATK